MDNSPAMSLRGAPLGVFSIASPTGPTRSVCTGPSSSPVKALRIQVSEPEALDRTPVIDIKPRPPRQRRDCIFMHG